MIKRDPNKISIYTASAGSGKTYTLTKEYLRLSMEGNSATWNVAKASSVLAITFTNAATADMKRRILETFWDISKGSYNEGEGLADEMGLSVKELKYRALSVLKYLLHHYGRFSVLTIDGFVQKVIRPFAFELGLPRTYEADTETSDWAKAIKDALLSDYSRPGQAFLTDVLDGFMQENALLGESADANIEISLENVLNRAFEERSLPYIKALKVFSEKDFLNKIEEFEAFRNETEKAFSILYKAIIDLLKDNDVDPSVFHNGQQSSLTKFCFSNFRTVKNALDFYLEKRESKSWVASLEKGVFKEDKLEFQVQDMWWKKYNQLSDLDWDYYSKTKAVGAWIYTLSLMNKAEEYKEQLQQKSGKVPISEFNRKIHDLLQDTDIPYLYERVGSIYRHILIDEFQDTSVLQWENLKPLIDNNRANGNWNMLVGDPKQSIYRFRSANVEQMVSLQNNEHEVQNVYLESNWRSHQGIVAFNNLFYTFLTEEYEPKPDRKEALEEWRAAKPRILDIYKHHEQYYKGDTTKRPQKDISRVKICFYNNIGLSSFEEWSCYKILEIIKKHTPGEVAILCSTNAEVSVISAYLVECGYAVRNNESLSVKMSLDVRILISAIRYMFSPYSDEYKKRLCWHLDYANFSNECICAFLFYLKVLRLSGRSLYDKSLCILRYLGIKSNIDQYVLTFLDALYSTSASTEMAFLEEWDRKDMATRCKIQSSSIDKDAVRIATVHSSKGLEYPVVIEAFAFSTPKPTSPIWIKEPMGVKKTDLPAALVKIEEAENILSMSAAAKKEKTQAIVDKLNALYVATTRAKEYLYVLSMELKTYKKHSEALYWKAFGNRYPEYVEVERLSEIAEDEEADDRAEEIVDSSTDETVEGVMDSISDCSENVADNTDWMERFEPLWSKPNTIKTQKMAVSRGLFIHNILSKFEYRLERADLEKEMNKIWDAEARDLYNYAEVVDMILKLWDTEIIAAAFAPDPDCKTYIEREIAFDNNIYRPDRVSVTANCTYLIDYKTGEDREEYRQQLGQYTNLLEKMGYKNIKAYVVYLGEDIEVKGLD